MILRVSLLAAVIGLLVAGPASANDSAAHKNDFGTWSFQLENDLFAGADRHYTNGLRVSWLSPDGDTVEWLDLARDALESIALDEDNLSRGNKQVRFGVSLGQDIYTPEDRARTDVILDDRPYAGWLYGAAALHTITDHGMLDSTKTGLKDLESVELQIGMVGPWALGEQAQNLIHELRLIDTFKGWDNQINNEPGIMLLYERKWRLAPPTPVLGSSDPAWSGLEIDFIPSVGASLGNVITEARTGGAVRLGWNIPENFGPPSLIQGGASFHEWGAATDGSFTDVSVYLFATAEGRYVARNIFLDGNTFEDSHSLHKRHWVGDLSLGLSVLLGPVNVSYASAFRTREFDGQDRLNRFGSVTLTWQATF